MTLQQLTYFQAACRYQNISRAAEELHISQPSISAAIKNLEEEFGVRLIVRGRVGFTWTETGEELLSLAEGLLEHADRVQGIMVDKGRKNHKVRLGMPPMSGTILFPMLYSDFMENHREVQLEVREAGRGELYRQLKDNLLDLAFLPYAEELAGEYHVQPVISLETVCCVSDRHPLAIRKCVAPKDLQEEPLVVFSREFFQNELILRMFSKAGIEPHIMHTSSQVSTVERLVADNIAVGFLFGEFAKQLPGIRCVPFEQPLFTTISLVWKKELHLHGDMVELIEFFKATASGAFGENPPMAERVL